MNRTAVFCALAVVCACHKREEATPTPQPPPAETTVVAATAPSETAAASASAAPVTSADRERAREEAIRQAREFGLIGVLNADDAGLATLLGHAPEGTHGNTWGDTLGDSYGMGGLGLSTAGDAGGGGIGLGNIGTIGHGGTGGGQGFGSGQGRLGGAHRNTPKLRQGTTTVNGRLPPEVIQRIVRQNFGRFRLCYENGLRSDPKLAGMVATKFVIGTDGSVTSTARDSSTTMSDAGVVSCVTRAFSNLSFPQPEGGIVTVVYPLIFEPGE